MYEVGWSEVDDWPGVRPCIIYNFEPGSMSLRCNPCRQPRLTRVLSQGLKGRGTAMDYTLVPRDVAAGSTST